MKGYINCSRCRRLCALFMVKKVEYIFKVQRVCYPISCVYCSFFGNAGLVYWDLPLPMFVLQLRNIVYDTPYGQVGFGGNERNSFFTSPG